MMGELVTGRFGGGPIVTGLAHQVISHADRIDIARAALRSKGIDPEPALIRARTRNIEELVPFEDALEEAVAWAIDSTSTDRSSSSTDEGSRAAQGSTDGSPPPATPASSESPSSATATPSGSVTLAMPWCQAGFSAKASRDDARAATEPSPPAASTASSSSSAGSDENEG